MFSSLLIFALGAAPVPPGPSVYLPPNLYLVRATTVKVWKNPKEYYERGQLKITAVLCGPDRLRGKEFEANTRDHYAETAFGSKIAVANDQRYFFCVELWNEVRRDCGGSPRIPRIIPWHPNCAWMSSVVID